MFEVIFPSLLSDLLLARGINGKDFFLKKERKKKVKISIYTFSDWFQSIEKGF